MSLETTGTISSASLPYESPSYLSSRKRSRLLFGADHVPSQARLAIPHCGYTISDRLMHKSVVARRVRLHYPVIPMDSSSLLNVEPEDMNNNSKDAPPKSAYSTSQVLDELKKQRWEALSRRPVQNSTSQEPQVQPQLLLQQENDVQETQIVPMNNPSSKSTAVSMALVPGQLVVHTASNTQTATNPSHNTANHTQSKVVSSNQSSSNSGILTAQSKQDTKSTIPTPQWHAPWKLSTVISSHLGWVRCVALDPTNDMFCTGSADRTIKVFDLAKACVGASDALKLTLTGHISAVRGLAFSSRHPYLFSAGEDKMIKCWDLETNQVVRHYHGHLSGIYALRLHPTLDLIITGGRDAVARVWDIRTKYEVACLTGHDNTVGSILTKSTDPQVITGSHDSTIKLWDLAAGKCMTTLTHHKKSIRALAQPMFENTFLSGSADMIKKWQAKDGRLIQNFNHNNMKSRAIVNAMCISEDGVVVSAADNGSMNFWDYATGYCFQQTCTTQQPGSLDAENGIFCAEFDLTGTRLITGEADKSIKIWKQEDDASEMDYPVDLAGWRKHVIAERKIRY